MTKPQTDPGGQKGQFEGYSDYRTIANKHANHIHDAIRAYAQLEGQHTEGARIRPEMAAEARRDIKGAALQLVPELEADAASTPKYAEILARWKGPHRVPEYEPPEEPASDGGQPEPEASQGEAPRQETADWTDEPDEGYLRELRDIQLQNECPDWLEQFVLDIKTAGFELGYLQAGRTVSINEDADPIEEDVNSMFNGLDIG